MTFAESVYEPHSTVLRSQLPMRTMPQLSTVAPHVQTMSPSYRAGSQMDGKSHFILGLLSRLTAVQLKNWRTRSNQ